MADALQVQNHFAVGAEEVFRVEKALRLIERVFQNPPLAVGIGSEGQAVFGIQVSQRLGEQVGELLARFDQQPFLVGGRHKLPEQLGEIRRFSLPGIVFVKGEGEFLFVYRFEQVVDAIDFEGFQSVLIVSCRE